MDPTPVTLAREDTPDGEVALRRRGAVLELVVDGAFAMDGLDPSSEVLLATLALADHASPERVLVGGLGLGFTARAVLADPRVRHLDVVELAEPLVRWARAGLAPELAGLEGPRCRLHVADVAQVLTGAASPAGPWDVVLLDVDNGPGFLVHPGNADLWTPDGLASALRALNPGGVLGLWSATPAPAVLAALRALAGPGDRAGETVVPGRREGRSTAHVLYSFARTTGAGGG